MKINDALVGVMLALLGGVILFHVQDYPTIPGQKYGPAIFPGLIACGLIICGVLLARNGWRAGGRAVTLAPWLRSTHHATNFLFVLGALAFYIVAAEVLGFIATGTVILLALFWKLGVRAAIGVPIALVATLLVHTVFYKMMRVPLPWGVLNGLTW